MLFAINGKPFMVLQMYIEGVPKLGVYRIEDGPDHIVNYGLYNKVYKAVLYLTSKDELDELEQLLQYEYVNLTWDDETFKAVPLNYRSQIILDKHDKSYKVEVAFKRAYSKFIGGP